MPKLVIDGREIEVPAGTKVIEAAERLGIMIPRFCYHEELGSVGACRMCAVKFLQGPFKGLQMSCMVDAQDGMVVSTTDPEAVEFRRSVIEWLMMNHPHDCPVCDEGGQCLLQDETVSGGHGLRRYLGRKRTYRDQDLGPFIQHEMNRCIHCYRCSRFYRDFAGYRDFGPMQSANRVYFGRFKDGALESPFSGNLVDVCPTGVFTDKTARFRARRWDLERSASLCIHCSLGCNTVANARYREVLRVEGRFSSEVNGHFICDRGRFSFGYAAHRDRPRRARIAHKAAGMDETMKVAALKLTEIIAESGAGAVALLGSDRSSLETQAMLVRLARLSGFRPPVFFVDPVARKNSRKAVSLLDATVAVSLRALKDADGIVAVGVDPVAEAPMLALWMRQAVRKEARVAVLDPRPVTLPFDFTHVAQRRGELCGGLKGLAGAVAADAGAAHEGLGGVARMLASAKRPVVVCGTGITSEADIEAAAALARTLRSAGKDAGLFFVLPGPNAFGAVLAENSCGASGDFLDILEAIELGEVRALVAVECDPFFRFHDRKRLQAALAKLDLFVALDCVPSDTVNRADFFFPTATLFERGGHFVNQEGRVQSAEPVHSGGAPVRHVSGGGHPPRTFRCDIPGGDHAAAWRLLEELGQALTGEGELSETAAKEGPWPGLWAFAAEAIEALRPWKDLPVPEGGLRVLPESVADGAAVPAAADAETGVPGDALDLLIVDDIFGTEELSTYSEYLARVQKEPVLRLHEEDARLAGLKDGEFACLRLPLGEVAVRVETSVCMARRTLVLPRYAGLDWRRIDHLPATLPAGDVFRAKAS